MSKATPDKKRYILIGRLHCSVNVCETFGALVCLDQCGKASDVFSFALGLCWVGSISFCDCSAKIGPPLWGLKWWCGYRTSPTRWNFWNSHIHPDTPTTFSSTKTVKCQGENTNMIFMWRRFSSPRGISIHIAAHSVRGMKNLVLIQFVNGHLGRLKIFSRRNAAECETEWRT